jgi:hypothetical protein
VLSDVLNALKTRLTGSFECAASVRPRVRFFIHCLKFLTHKYKEGDYFRNVP